MVWSGSFFDNFLYLQPDRFFSCYFIPTALFLEKQAPYHCVFFLAGHPQYLLVFVGRKLAHQHQFYLYHRCRSGQRFLDRFYCRTADRRPLYSLDPYQSGAGQRLFFPHRRSAVRIFIGLAQTQKRNAAPRHRDQFYFRCQSHHFAGPVLLSL